MYHLYIQLFYEIAELDLSNFEQIDSDKLTDIKHCSTKNNNRRIEILGASTNSGEAIFNEDRTLSCKLKSWELIGIFKGNQLITTQGEFIFEIKNLDSETHKWVLFELLILDDEGNVQITSNPFRDLQGEMLRINPPIDPKESRILNRGWKYRDGWNKVTLTSCQWANSPDDYWKKYPELRDYPAP